MKRHSLCLHLQLGFDELDGCGDKAVCPACQQPCEGVVFHRETFGTVLFAIRRICEARKPSSIVMQTSQQHRIRQRPSKRRRSSALVQTEKRFATRQLQKAVEWTSIRAECRALHAHLDRVERVTHKKLRNARYGASDESFDRGARLSTVRCRRRRRYLRAFACDGCRRVWWWITGLR